MNEFISIKLDRNKNIPLYQQLGDSLRELIENGILKPNSKLPPIRVLSNHLKLNTITVINAYKYLENKKIVYSKTGSGTYVSDLEINNIPEPVLKYQGKINYRNELPLKNAVNFADSSVSADLFPVEKFKELFNIVLDRDKGNAFSYQDSQGYKPLREAISLRLEKKSIKAMPERIQIISGAQQGIDIISKVMLSPGDIVFVEKPTYYGAVGAILSRGARIIEVPLCSDGIDLKQLENLFKFYQPKFIYVMTYYQTPTCISYSLEKKRELLEIANYYNVYIVEEDNLSDFNYTDNIAVTLKALDYKNKVIYIRSFSKILMPGLRLGYMVLPKMISDSVLNVKYTTDISTSSFIQRAFELFLNGDDWESHIKYMRSIFKRKYETTTLCLNKYLSKYLSYVDPQGGLSLWLEINNKSLSPMDLCSILIKENVAVIPGSIYSITGNDKFSYIRINFSNVEDNSIKFGIKTIKDVFEKI